MDTVNRLGELIKELETRIDDMEKESDENIEGVEQRVDNCEIVLARFQAIVMALRDENRALKRKLRQIEACIIRHFGEFNN